MSKNDNSIVWWAAFGSLFILFFIQWCKMPDAAGRKRAEEAYQRQLDFDDAWREAEDSYEDLRRLGFSNQEILNMNKRGNNE